ncbi:MAG: thiamine pyrophosphate-dependent enzyme [Bacteroidaceae bacterium]|nr:thiamine pyrophosphate-dependent enzyme [Bacteroidaceae bacterium]
MNLGDYKEEIKKAIFIRQFETKLLQLFSEGRINGTVHTCVGEELNAVVLCKYLKEDDIFLSNHRGHGHFIAKTRKAYELMAEMMGRKTGISFGCGGSQHLLTKGFISNGVQGGMTPIAAGIAFSFKLDKIDNIAVSFLGDGTLGEGIVYESFNVTRMLSLPVLYVLENNHYAQSTCNKQTLMGDIKKRAEGFGLTYFHTNIWDLDEMNNVVSEAVNCARSCNPVLLEIDCYRLNSHSKGDDNRNKEEVDEYQRKDLINVFSKQFEEEYINYKEEAVTAIDEIVEKAEKDEVQNDVPNHNYVFNEECDYEEYVNESLARGGESIHEAMVEQFGRNEKSILIGEDVANNSPYTGVPYGGAFKITKELSDLYPERVRNMPISEQAIIGVGIGLALKGYYPIDEIMFGDFMTLTLDQILQHASKFCEMYGRKVELPLIIRTPMGGRRGYGPTHSQSIEKHFLGIPNVNVLAINNCVEPKFIYRTLFKNINKPTIVIENKVLYTHSGFRKQRGFALKKTNEIYPTIIYRPESNVTDMTIVCYGGMAEIVKDVIEELAFNDIICEMVCLTSLMPLNIYPILLSVKRSKKILIVEEGPNFAALGSEIVTSLVENHCDLKCVKRIGNNAVIPCSLPAENNLLPNKDSIITIIRTML